MWVSCPKIKFLLSDLCGSQYTATTHTKKDPRKIPLPKFPQRPQMEEKSQNLQFLLFAGLESLVSESTGKMVFTEPKPRIPSSQTSPSNIMDTQICDLTPHSVCA